MFLYVVLDVLSVVTVAYAFVPGGQLLRERGGLVISIAFLLVVLGDWYLPQIHEDPRRNHRHREKASSPTPRYAVLLVSLLALSSWIFQYRFQHGLNRKTYNRVSAPGKPEGLFTAGIWTVSRHLRTSVEVALISDDSMLDHRFISA